MKYEVIIPDRYEITEEKLVKILNENIDGAWIEPITARAFKDEETKPTRVGIISCSKQKNNWPSIARIVYWKSPLFRKAYEYCKKTYDEVYIVSSKYQLITPMTEITPYDETILDKPKHVRDVWGYRVAKQIILKTPLNSEYYFHMGKKYREAIIPNLQPKYKIHIPLEGLGIGQQMKWYNEQ